MIKLQPERKRDRVENDFSPMIFYTHQLLFQIQLHDQNFYGEGAGVVDGVRVALTEA